MLDTTSKVPDGLRLTVVPLMTAAGPPAEITVPAMVNAEGLGVNLCPPTVYTSLGVSDSVGRWTVEPPIAKAPDWPRLMMVPSIVAAGPPSETMVPSI